MTVQDCLNAQPEMTRQLRAASTVQKSRRLDHASLVVANPASGFMSNRYCGTPEREIRTGVGSPRSPKLLTMQSPTRAKTPNQTRQLLSPKRMPSMKFNLAHARMR